MTYNELRDIAYKTATGNHLTETYDYEEFQNLDEEDIWDVLWEPLENWEMGHIIGHIDQIAEEFIRRVEELENENK